MASPWSGNGSSSPERTRSCCRRRRRCSISSAPGASSFSRAPMAACVSPGQQSAPGAVEVSGESAPFVSECRLQACVKGARPCRADRTRVGEGRAAIGEIGHVSGIEERPVGRIAIVEDVVYAPIDLEHLVDLIRGVEIENSISWQPRELIGFIADKILVADKQGVSTYLEGISDRVIHPELDAVAGYRRNSIARHDGDIAVRIGKRAVGADLQGIK